MDWSTCFLVIGAVAASALDLRYLDPTKLQTRTSAQVQSEAALQIITKYMPYRKVQLDVNPLLFKDKKDTFTLRTLEDKLHIGASSGVAAVWGFNYYLKKYCNSQITWREKNVQIPSPLPRVDESVVASDRFRYYQNVCTASYSAAWWSVQDWLQHVDWMALNGINLSLAPIAQEAAWASIYRQLGLTSDDLDEHFTGPAFLAWLRMGNVRGWGGPLPNSWHNSQLRIQRAVVDYMYKLGIIPVLPTFSGHVPRAFAKLFPNHTFHEVGTWNSFSDEYCCGLFVSPTDPLFQQLGDMFLRETAITNNTSHIYTTDPFNEVEVKPWSTELVENTAKAIFSVLKNFDDDAVWLVQNWMFVHDPLRWSLTRVKSFITAVPPGRMLILDLQAEQWPQYDLYDMYYGQPFIWCMLHNFGGTLGMFGNTESINKNIYEVRKRDNSTMIGMGLTPEGIFQNYMVYDLMLETAWRKEPVADLNAWVLKYALRRYGCDTGTAWKYLLKSVYSFNGLNKIRGKYTIVKRPSFRLKPWAWYKSRDLFTAWRKLALPANGNCVSDSFLHDVVDVTRQALQYRAEQIYLNLVRDRMSDIMVFNSTVHQYLDVMNDMQAILSTHKSFTSMNWLPKARGFATGPLEYYLYELNARNQITLWGPNGEITDYACKQWAELFKYYYIPRWKAFLAVALDAKIRNERFDERGAQDLVRSTVERNFTTVNIKPLLGGDAISMAEQLYSKWAVVPGLEDLPMNIISADPVGNVTYTTVPEETASSLPPEPTVIMLSSTLT